MIGSWQKSKVGKEWAIQEYQQFLRNINSNILANKTENWSHPRNLKNPVYNRWNSQVEAMSWSHLGSNINVIVFSHFCSQVLSTFSLYKINFEVGEQGICESQKFSYCPLYLVIMLWLISDKRRYQQCLTTRFLCFGWLWKGESISGCLCRIPIDI